MVSHFFNDITHFDGKFFSTLSQMVRRPGGLPADYLIGRRARYLHPIRMYVFSSAFFFIFFYSMFNPANIDMGSPMSDSKRDSLRAEIVRTKDVAMKAVDNSGDSGRLDKVFKVVQHQRALNLYANPRALERGGTFSYDDYNSKRRYDSIQNTLPADKRDNWITRKVKHRTFEINEKYEGDEQRMLRDLLDKFLHTMPYLLFISLPLYAMFLKLLYVRRKRFFYVDHGIFLIYLYIFTFILMLFVFGLGKINDYVDSGALTLLITFLLGYGAWYTLKAMKNFYGQRWGKTILKFTLLNILAFISLLILFTLFMLITLYRI